MPRTLKKTLVLAGCAALCALAVEPAWALTREVASPWLAAVQPERAARELRQLNRDLTAALDALDAGCTSNPAAVEARREEARVVLAQAGRQLRPALEMAGEPYDIVQANLELLRARLAGPCPAAEPQRPGHT